MPTKLFHRATTSIAKCAKISSVGVIVGGDAVYKGSKYGWKSIEVLTRRVVPYLYIEVEGPWGAKQFDILDLPNAIKFYNSYEKHMVPNSVKCIKAIK